MLIFVSLSDVLYVFLLSCIGVFGVVDCFKFWCVCGVVDVGGIV